MVGRVERFVTYAAGRPDIIVNKLPNAASRREFLKGSVFAIAALATEKTTEKASSFAAALNTFHQVSTKRDVLTDSLMSSSTNFKMAARELQTDSRDANNATAQITAYGSETLGFGIVAALFGTWRLALRQKKDVIPEKSTDNKAA